MIENGLPWMGPPVKREGETLHLRLWWSVEEPLPLDYSVGLYLMRGDELLASDDSAPQVSYPADAPPETSRWQTGSYYIENREITLPYPTSRSTYTVYLAVYFWQDGKRIAAPGLNENDLLPLYRFPVMSY
ncbi:MAG TPA: hypothetical protein VHO69_05820 [Phototrophicaceae bacterium]|nr:hypothetical protein [Phototrophicaceae bacterium]